MRASCKRRRKAHGAFLRRLVVDVRGQETVEYTVLTSLLAVVVLVAFEAIGAGLAAAYWNWNTNIHNLWVPPSPTGRP